MATDIIARGMANQAQKLASQASEFATSAEQSAQISQAAANIASVAQSSAEETLSSIPEDYTELSASVEELKGDLVEQKVTLGVTSNSKVKSDFFNFILGGMYSTTGEISLLTTYAYSDIKPIGKGSVIIVPNIGIAYIIGIATYDKNKSFIKRLPNVSYATGGEIVLDFDVEYVAFNFGVAGSLGRNIEESDLEKFEIKVINNNSVYGLIDETYDNALKYGFVNDGVTDNSDAFLNYLENHKDGFRLFFPGGIYSFAKDIIIDGIDNFVIDGHGILKLANNVYTDTTTEAIYFLRVINGENITIKNITINGNKTNNPIYYYGTSADALTFDDCNQINIENIKVIDAIDSGIFVTNSRGVHISKCRVIGTRVSVNSITFSISGSTLTVNGTFSSKSKGKYILLTSGTYCAHGVITDVKDDFIKCKIINIYGQQNNNEGNVLVFDGDAGIYLNNCINLDGSYIDDNYVFSFVTGIHCNRGCSQLKISNNNVHNCISGMDLTTYDTTDGITYINPTKNIITSNQFTVDAVGIACRIAENTVLSNNVIKSNLRGIELSGCNSIIASGNMIIGAGLSVDSYAGIVLSKGRKDGVIYKTDYVVLNGNMLSTWYNGIRKNIDATNIIIAEDNGFIGITNNNISDGDAN